MSNDIEERVHVYPPNDLKEHVLKGTRCWCFPEVNEEGMVIHKSADGREDFETGKRRLS